MYIPHIAMYNNTHVQSLSMNSVVRHRRVYQPSLTRSRLKECMSVWMGGVISHHATLHGHHAIWQCSPINCHIALHSTPTPLTKHTSTSQPNYPLIGERKRSQPDKNAPENLYTSVVCYVIHIIIWVDETRQEIVYFIFLGSVLIVTRWCSQWSMSSV